MKHTGQVRQVNEVKFKPEEGIILWSFHLEGSGRFFRCGRTNPELEEGEWIEFEEKEGNVDVKSITRVEKPAGVGAKAAPSEPASTSTSKQSSTAGDVASRLRYQAARSDATKVVVAALAADHLPHAANIAKAKRLDLLMGYVEQVTQELLKQEESNV